MSPSELFPPAPLCSQCVPAMAVQNLGMPLEYSPYPVVSTSSIPMVHFQNTGMPLEHSQNPVPSTSSISMVHFQNPVMTLEHSPYPVPSTSSIPVVHLTNPVMPLEHSLHPVTSTSSISMVHFQSPVMTLAHSQHPVTSSSSISTVHIQNQACSCGEFGQSTRLVSQEDNRRTETVLQIPDVQVDETHGSGMSPDGTEPDAAINDELKDSTSRSPDREFTRRQWCAVVLAWSLAFSGLVIFVAFLVLSFIGYSHLLNTSSVNIFIIVNGVISLVAAIYFCDRMHKYYS